MKEVIIKLTSDHIKVKGGEYVRDLVRCGECKWHSYDMDDECRWRIEEIPKADDFCSYGERAEPPIDGRELTIGNGTIPKGYGEREEEKNCPEYYDPSAWE